MPMPKPVSGLHTAVAVVAALLLVLAASAASYAAPGGLDPQFGTAGLLATDFGGGEEAKGTVVQPDGKIIAVGVSDGDFALARYNPDGTPDTTFDGDGRVTTDIGGGWDVANAVALQPDGKIVAVGTSEVIEGGCCWFTVARYRPDGSRDAGFGTGGAVVGDFGGGGADHGAAVAVQPDGRIVAAGTSGGHYLVARYRTNGEPDPTFDGDGWTRTDLAGPMGGGTAHDLALQSDGRIVVAGEVSRAGADSDFALVRYQADGALDPGFGTAGIAVTDIGLDDEARAVAVQPDGRIVAAGGSAGDFALTRHLADGALDTSFDGDGKVTTDVSGGGELAYDVAVQRDGRIVAAGAAADFVLARYQSAGALDAGFGAGGRVVTDFGGAEAARGLALQPDGKILAAGFAGPDFALARYEGAGGTTPPAPADLTVTKTGPAATSIGDRPAYTVTVRNTSAAAAAAVTVTDALTGPAATLLSATPSQGGCTTMATGASCALGTLAGGAAATVTVVAEPRATGTLTDRATAATGAADPTPADNTGTAATAVDNARGCTQVGTSGPDTLTGGPGDDVVCALSGNDTVRPGFGDDTVHAGPGDDVAEGSYGDDTLIGGPGGDRLDGGFGNDRLNAVDAVAGNDAADAGYGTDACTTDSGDARFSCP